MQPGFRAHLAFHLTGTRAAAEAADADERRLCPALLAAYRDPGALRGDYPLVLASGAPDGCLQSLSRVIDGLLQRLAPRGADGERLRRSVLRCERDLRTLAAAGSVTRLTSLWDLAADALAAEGGPAVAADLARARAELPVDGDVVGCDEQVPARVLEHLWRTVQVDKARRVRARVDALIIRLSDILRADFLGSAAGRTAEQLRASFGTTHGQAFDFEVMSGLLSRRQPQPAFAGRMRRVRWALSVLEHQPFYPGPHAVGVHAHDFTFDGCAAALAAYHERLPDMLRVAKALAIAELELDGLYVEARHDRFFEQFSAAALRPADLGLFPDYLVRLDSAVARPDEGARLLELLSTGLPIKVLVRSHDLLEPSAPGNGHLPFGARAARLAAMAMGLDQVFVLQAPSSHLYQVRDRLLRGLAAPGPALFSVFSGSSQLVPDLPPQLVAAAALQSRAFPVFSWDPWAGPELADRLSLEGNPQPERAWPVHRLAHEDAEQQRVVEQVAFTFADFAACDPRYASQLAALPGAAVGDALVPIADWLAGPGADDQVPCLTLVDGNDELQRVIVSEKLVRETARCADAWRSLQELGGIHNSHAERSLAHPAAAPAQAAAPAAAPAPVAEAAPPAPAADPAGERSPDEAYIETARCSSCNECIGVNPRMFAYDGNKQAYLANLAAGSFAQLVAAAENCQLSIIHPGKPRDPNEPDLAALLERAQPFQ